MPKRQTSRRKRASRTNSALAPLALLAIALLAGWLLFRPLHHTTVHKHAQRMVAGSTAPPREIAQQTVSAPTPTPLPVATTAPTAAPSETAAPSASAEPGTETSPAVTASPQTTPLPASAVQDANGPKLALIIDDCGQWITTERGFVALPIPLTLSVLPDVRFNKVISQEAAAAGKGIILHLPMETVSGMNPGPGKVTTEMSDAAITTQVEDDLAQVPLARGVNNHEGSKGSSDERVMRDVIAVLHKHGDLFFVDSKTSSTSVAETVAQHAGVPTAARDVFLDNHEDVAYSEMQLREAAAIAKRQGSAIAIGHPRPTTLAAVRALLPELQAQGIHFVLVQSLTH